MTELCDIAFQYGTDKCPQIKHHFTEFYAGLFPDRAAVRKVVEIGIGKIESARVAGPSLRMWRDYFQNAFVYGADIEPGLLFKDERIDTFLCDQTRRSDLEALVRWTGADVDLFIDDGLHTPGSQVFTALAVLPLLDKKTVYVIEDCASGRVDESLRQADFDVEVFQPRRRRYRDDRLVIVRLGDV